MGKGVMDTVKLFLKVRDCDPINASNCVQILDTADACCGHKRRFRALIGADCHVGDVVLSHVYVERLDFDMLQVVPEIKDALHMLGEGIFNSSLVIKLPTQNIAPLAEHMVKDLITSYLTEPEFLWWGDKYLSMAEVLTRVLRYNTPLGQFQC